MTLLFLKGRGEVVVCVCVGWEARGEPASSLCLPPGSGGRCRGGGVTSWGKREILLFLGNTVESIEMTERFS